MRASEIKEAALAWADEQRLAIDRGGAMVETSTGVFRRNPAPNAADFEVGARWAIAEVWRQIEAKGFRFDSSAFTDAEEICKIEEDK